MSGEAAGSVEPVHLPQPAVRLERWSWPLFAGATLTGALSALAAALVRLGFRGLQWTLTGSSADPPAAAAQLPLWRRFLTPAVGALLALTVLWLQRRRSLLPGRQPPRYVEYVEAVRHRAGFIPLLPNSWRTLSAAWSVASGAAVGREGSMIQFAAAVASSLGRWRRFFPQGELPLGLLVACGVAGGVTTAYHAPVAAVFFAAEIVLGGLQWLELPLLGVASLAGWLVSGSMLGWARLYPTATAVPWGWPLALLPLLAVVFGLLGPVYQWSLGALKRARRLPFALLWSGLLVGGLSVVDPRVWGNGDAGLRSALGIARLPGVAQPGVSLARLLLLRLAANLACVWTGTVGGVFTPTLFLGAALGSLFGRVLPGHPQPTLWAIAGMSLLLASVTHAPLMAAFMAVELTGDWALLALLLPLNLLAWQFARRLSPRAMYAIASQSPDTGPPPTEPPKTIQ